MAIAFEQATEFINHAAGTWLVAMRAALVQGSLTLGLVALFWMACRRWMSHAFAHGLFLIVPLKTAAAAMFVAWPVVIAFNIPVPDAWLNSVKPEMQQPARLPAAAAWPQEVGPGGERIKPVLLADRGLEATKMQARAVPLTGAAWAMLVWACACMALLAVFTVRSGRARRRIERSRRVVGLAEQDLVRQLAMQLKLWRAPEVWATPEVAGPAVVGLIRPRLLVPEGFFSDFNTDEIKWALMHELAHLRRCDLVWLGLERLVSICFFFHPAVWLARRATATFRELACDEAALWHSGLEPRLCALFFLKMVEQASRQAHECSVISPDLSLSSRFANVHRRIVNMMTFCPSSRPTGLSRKALVMITAAALLASLPIVPKLVAQAPAQGAAGGGQVKVEKWNFAGKVVDSANRPVTGAQVQLILFDDLRAGKTAGLPVVLTDALGHWSIDGVPLKFDQAGLSVTHPKFAQVVTGAKLGDRVFEELKNGGQVTRLEPGIRLSGKIMASDGQPVAGATVGDVSMPYFESPFATTMTNQAGEFVLENLRRESFSLLKARHEALGVATFGIRPEDGRDQSKTVRLEKAAAVQVTMLDSEGKPLPGVEVNVSQIIDDGHRVKQWTNAAGVVLFEGLPISKNIRVMALVPGFEGIIEELVLQERTEKIYRLKPGVRATGRVRDKATNKPIEAFRVKYQSTVENPQGVKLGQTFDATRGAFTAPALNLQLERYDIEISADGYRGFKSQEYRTADGAVSLDVLLEPISADELPRYQGKVVLADGTPAKNIRIGVVSPRDEPLLEHGEIQKTRKNRQIPTTNEAGAFDFQWLEPAVELLVVHETGAKRLLIKPGMDLKNLEIRLEPYGRLVASLAREGKPDLDSKISLYRSSALQSYIGQSVEGKQRADGKVEFERLIPGLMMMGFELARTTSNNWPSYSTYVQIPAGGTVVMERDIKRPAGPVRVVTGRLKFARKPQALDASRSLFMLVAPEGSPLRSTKPEEVAYNSEMKTKYRQTPEGRRLEDVLHGFWLLEKAISRDGEFRVSVPAGKYEMNIHVGSRNTLYGNARAALDIPELKPGEPNEPIDIGAVDVESVIFQKEAPAGNRGVIVVPANAAKKK